MAFRVLALQLQHFPELQTLDVCPVLVLTDIGSIKCHLISISPEEMNKWKIRMTQINDCIEEMAHSCTATARHSIGSGLVWLLLTSSSLMSQMLA